MNRSITDHPPNRYTRAICPVCDSPRFMLRYGRECGYCKEERKAREKVLRKEQQIADRQTLRRRLGIL